MRKDGPGTIDDLIKQVKTTNRLLTAQLKGQMSQMELIGLLTASDLTAREIGEIIGTSPATVAVTQQRLREKKKRKSEV